MKAVISPRDIPLNRRWRGQTLTALEEVLMFHDETGPVAEAFRRMKQFLENEGIDYVEIDALALAAHNYRRATSDFDICLRKEDLQRFRERFVGREYQAVEGRSRRFYDPVSEVTFDLLVSGELAGRTARNSEIRFPDPADAIEAPGLRTVSLAKLIELKLVTWRYKD